jgi:hypothetical protein
VPPLAYEQHLFIGTEYSDPTRYDLTVRIPEEDSIEAYLDFYQEIDEQLWDIETVEINGRPVPKVTTYGLGYDLTYLIEVNGTILAFSDWSVLSLQYVKEPAPGRRPALKRRHRRTAYGLTIIGKKTS